MWAHKGTDIAPRIPDFVYELFFFFLNAKLSSENTLQVMKKI